MENQPRARSVWEPGGARYASRVQVRLVAGSLTTSGGLPVLFSAAGAPCISCTGNQPRGRSVWEPGGAR